MHNMELYHASARLYPTTCERTNYYVSQQSLLVMLVGHLTETLNAPNWEFKFLDVFHFPPNPCVRTCAWLCDVRGDTLVYVFNFHILRFAFSSSSTPVRDVSVAKSVCLRCHASPLTWSDKVVGCNKVVCQLVNFLSLHFHVYIDECSCILKRALYYFISSFQLFYHLCVYM